MVPADASPWALPRIRPTDPAAQWYAGQASPRPGRITHRYEFDPQSVILSLRDEQPDAIHLDSSGKKLEPGVWILAVRLRHAYQLAGFIPVAKVMVSHAGDLAYEVYEGEFGVKPLTETAGAITTRRGSKARRRLRRPSGSPTPDQPANQINCSRQVAGACWLPISRLLGR